MRSRVASHRKQKNGTIFHVSTLSLFVKANIIWRSLSPSGHKFSRHSCWASAKRFPLGPCGGHPFGSADRTPICPFAGCHGSQPTLLQSVPKSTDNPNHLLSTPRCRSWCPHGQRSIFTKRRRRRTAVVRAFSEPPPAAAAA